MRGSTQMELETRISSRCIDSVHYAEANTGKSMDPAFLVPVNMKTNCLVDSFISALAGTVSFRVVGGRHFQLDASELCKSFPETQYKEFVAIGDKIRW